GASAGGLEQIKLLLKDMPTDTGAAFVVIQHLDPHHETHLGELLARAGVELPAVTIDDHMALAANQVHVLPAGQRLGMDDDGRLRLTAGTARETKPTLIDHFFRDLASVRGRRAVGIVLSGSGSDGALGLKAIRGAGGLAMAQHPDDAEFDGMPRAAAEHASPDCLLATADLIAPLTNHLSLTLAPGQPPAASTCGEPDDADSDDSDDSIDDGMLEQVLEVLRAHNKHDFRHHKPKMLWRRLHRRMALN